MTKQEQMLQVIETGIEGWIASCFAGDSQPTDSLTDYPLTLETARIYYRSNYPYSALEETFLESVGDVEELDCQTLQQWVNYHWQYAHLELAEDFSNIHIEVTKDMLERRQQIREEMRIIGYRLVAE